MELHAASKVGLGPCKHVVGDVDQHDLVTGLGKRLGDARPDDACAHDSDAPQVLAPSTRTG